MIRRIFLSSFAGSPGSADETVTLLLLKADDFTARDLSALGKLSAGGSASALQYLNLDAFVWTGGRPLVPAMDFAPTSSFQPRLIAKGDALPKLAALYGTKAYPAAIIPKFTYRATTPDKPQVARRLSCDSRAQKPSDEARTVTRTRPDISLNGATTNAPVPFHPGVARYLPEKGIE